MMTIEPKVYKLKNHIQNYKWGAKGKNAFIPKLLGIKNEEKPYAELWIGAHPKLSSEIFIDNIYYQLNSIIENFPNEILGKTVAEKFDGKLPFLLKVLSAKKALSIQTHPNKEEAERLNKLYPEYYSDNNHKPEIAVALDYLKAMVGFRPLENIEDNLTNYPQLAEFIGKNDILEFKKEKSTENLKKLFSVLMQQAGNKLKLEITITSIKDKIEKSNNITEDEKLFIDLYTQYGVDIGVLVLFFLNVVKLNAGEGIFTPAGIPHAYIEGNIVECMANSDNVIRAGLTTKFKDVNELLKILTYKSGKPEIIGKAITGNIVRYDVGISEFILDKIEIPKGDNISINNQNKIEIILVIKGEIEIKNETLFKGDSCIIPGLLSNYNIKTKVKTLLFRVFMP
jgi:mannose-6-phosphate isomerase